MSRTVPKNPKLFRQLSEPFNSRDDAKAALEQFYSDVSAARERAKLRDVYVIAAYDCLGSDGGEETFMPVFKFGDQLRGESMTAFAFGYERAEREKMIASLLKAGKPDV